jgi:hypothetical protein
MLWRKLKGSPDPDDLVNVSLKQTGNAEVIHGHPNHVATAI